MCVANNLMDSMLGTQHCNVLVIWELRFRYKTLTTAQNENHLASEFKQSQNA